MELYTAEEMKAIDRHAIDTVGIPAEVLMELAGRAAAATAARLMGRAEGRRVLVLAGKGSNGGDGFVAARALHGGGAAVQIWVSEEPSENTPAAVQLRAARAVGVPVETYRPGAPLLPSSWPTVDLCLDALLGVGARGAPTGVIAEMINASAGLPAPILAIDLPSGLDGSTGEVPGPCVHAEATVTFGVGKIGLFSDPGRQVAGRVEVAEIGYPQVSLNTVQPGAALLTARGVAPWLPPRPDNANKGDFGPGVVIAGSAGMMGAAALCSRAAMRAGCGLVRLVVPERVLALANTMTFEVICRPVPAAPPGVFGMRSLEAILKTAENAKAIALGPGIGTDGDTAALLQNLLPQLQAPMVIDADALNILAKQKETLRKLRCPAVLTPHPGEMGRLTGCPTGEIQKRRLHYARALAEETGAVVVLKGAATLIADPDSFTWINSSGNPGLATAGAGDVLTGTILGLLAQGLEPQKAASAGVFLHGLAADIVGRRNGTAGMMAGDVVESLPEAQVEARSSS